MLYRKEDGYCIGKKDEGYADYRPGGYHPVKLGEMCGDYRIVSKLGWGHFSTVWKAVNEKKNPGKFYALKIMRSNEKYAEAAHDEIEVLKTITKNDPENNNFCTHIIDSFSLKGPNGVRTNI